MRMSYRTLELNPIANSGGCARHVVRKEDGSALEVEEGLFILIIVVVDRAHTDVG
jgi:hypothetical protein